MDKNIVAFIRNDTRTVGVKFFKDYKSDNTCENKPITITSEERFFNLYDKEYTYITTDPNIRVGDLYVVFVGNIPRVVVVSTVHEELAISPNDDIKHKWLVCPVNLDNYLKQVRKNAEITKMIEASYRTNIKNQFKNSILAGMDSESQLRLTEILGDSNNG